MRGSWKVAAASAAVLAAGGAAVATAQQPVPTVNVAATPTTVTVQSTGPVAAGPTTLHVTKAKGGRDLSIYVFLLNPGVSLQEFQTTIRRDDRTNGSTALGLISMQASMTIAGSQTSNDVTFTLKPGLDYVVASEPQTQNGPPPSRGFTTLTTSATANGATAPKPDATIRMVDLRFRGSRVLPRNGTVRVENFGGVPHIAIAFPLRRGVSAAQFGRVARSGNERAFGRIAGGQPVELQNLLGGGGAANDHAIRFSRAGRYGLLCFVDDHEKLGMYRVITVR
jgi:uncharacterized cupredoxin-like copper-binding protein